MEFIVIHDAVSITL